MKGKVWDIQQPTDNWGKGYACLAYALEALRAMSGRKIEVSYHE